MLILFYLVIFTLIAFLSIYIHRNHKFSNSEMISLSALCLSSFMAFNVLLKDKTPPGFNIFSYSIVLKTIEMNLIFSLGFISIIAFIVLLKDKTPPKIDILGYNFVFALLHENERRDLVKNIIWYDIENKLTKQGQIVKEKLCSDLNIKDVDKHLFFNLPKDKSIIINYVPEKEYAQRFIDAAPPSIPIVMGITVINRSSALVEVNDIFLKLESENHIYFYVPTFEVKEIAFYRKKFEQLADFVEGVMHPFYLKPDTEKVIFLYFRKNKCFNKKGKELSSFELVPGTYKRTIYCKFSGKIFPKSFDEITLSEDNWGKIVLENKYSMRFEDRTSLFDNIINKSMD